MKNKNGFTLIELIVCFALVATVTISLFKTVLAIQQKQAKNLSYNSYLSFVSVLNNTIQKDFISDVINSISSCGANCYDITYQNKGIIRLEVNKTNNTITYDSNTEKLPNNYKFYKDISLTNHAAVSTSNLNSYYLLRLPIKSDFIANMEDIKYMHQYNNEENYSQKYILNLNLNGGTFPTELNNLLYSAGTSITLPIPTKKNYVFTGWKKENNELISGNTFVMGDSNVSLKANYKFSFYNFQYIKNSQTFIIPESGYYKLKVWGASGGNKTTVLGGKGGYTEGIFYFNESVILYITVGGKGTSDCINNSCAGGYNGGGMGSITYYGSGGGATHIATAPGLLSTFSENTSPVLIVAGGGGGASNKSITTAIHPGGYGGGIIGGDGDYQASNPTYNGKGGSQTEGGAKANCIIGTFGQGGGRATNSAGGGGGWYGGSCGYSSSGGGGSSYISDIKINDSGIFIKGNEEVPTYDGTSTKIGNSGDGYASIEYIDYELKNIYNYSNVGIQEKFVAPYTGVYKLEVWGADGGNKNTILGGKGGYSVGTISLNNGDILYITIGGKGTSDCAANSYAGGYNGGGMGSVTYYGSGGGATHIATAPGLLSTFSENTSPVLIVAGGGGGASNKSITTAIHPGGYGGGIVGGDGDYQTSNPTYNGKGGSQTEGGAKANCIIGTFGQGGGRATNSAGGGGGWYGGSCGYSSSGGGGSGYIGGVTSSTTYNVTANTINGSETISTHDGMVESNNDGYARITYLGE